MFTDTVILANGVYPSHPIALGHLKLARRIICCDGSVNALVENGYEPFAIVGDCDSLDQQIAEKYQDKIFRDEDQETNDLTKSVKWCSDRNYSDVVILGATGKREDHTLGNISLLVEYAHYMKVIMVTDTGIFHPLLESTRLKSAKGQQISIFSITPDTEIDSTGLKYSLTRRKIRNWWEATLNEATDDYFELDFTTGQIIVFLKFMD